MAIQYDTVATGVADANTVSASLTVANNGNRLLIALIGIGDNEDTIGSVVWNTSESFTQAGTATTSSDQQVEIWYLIAPTPTTSTVVATASGSQTPDMSITALSLYGVNPVGAVSNFSSNTGNSTDPSTAIETDNANSWIVDILAVEDPAKTYTPEGSQTERSDFVGGSGAGTFTNATSTKPTTDAGANSTSWTIPTSAEVWVMASVEVAESLGSFSPSKSPSISPSRSPSTSPSVSISPSISPSTSPSVSISPSISPSTSPSISISPSRSPSLSPSISPSVSPSVSISPSKSPSLSPSVSISPSKSPSVSPSTAPNTFETSNGDGGIYKDDATWAGSHDATSGTADYSGAVSYALSQKYGSAFRIYRFFMAFDTSAIPADANIVGATLRIGVYGSAADGDNDDQAYLGLYQSSQASPDELVANDFDNIGSTLGSDTIDITGITPDQYLTFTLNATGLSWINLSGYTLIGIREGHDAENVAYAGADNTSSGVTLWQWDALLNVTYILPSTSPSQSPSVSISPSASPSKSPSVSPSTSPSVSVSPSPSPLNWEAENRTTTNWSDPDVTSTTWTNVNRGSTSWS